jgi:hypothetical protein
MKVEHNLQSRIPCPANSLVENWKLSLNVWISIKRSYSPVTYGNSNVIQTDRSYLLEVCLCDPCIPVLFQLILSSSLSQCLCEGVLVHDSTTVCPRCEEGRRNPRLKDEPTSKIDTTHLVIVVVEAQSASVQAIPVLIRKEQTQGYILTVAWLGQLIDTLPQLQKL